MRDHELRRLLRRCRGGWYSLFRFEEAAEEEIRKLREEQHELLQGIEGLRGIARDALLAFDDSLSRARRAVDRGQLDSFLRRRRQAEQALHAIRSIAVAMATLRDVAAQRDAWLEAEGIVVCRALLSLRILDRLLQRGWDLLEAGHADRAHEVAFRCRREIARLADGQRSQEWSDKERHKLRERLDQALTVDGGTAEASSMVCLKALENLYETRRLGLLSRLLEDLAMEPAVLDPRKTRGIKDPARNELGQALCSRLRQVSERAEALAGSL